MERDVCRAERRRPRAPHRGGRSPRGSGDVPPHGARIRLYGLRHLRSSAAADDLAQQALLTVLEALRGARLREADKLAQFVLGTCRMTVLELRRTSHRQEELLATYGANLAPEPPSLPRLDDRRLAGCVRASRSATAPSSS